MSTIFVRVCAVLIALRSLTNLGKVVQGDSAILVFFGQIFHGSAAAVPALLVGLFMLVTGIAMWKPSKWAFPLIAAYAVYVPANLLLWTLTNSQELTRVGGIISSAADPSVLRWYGALAMVVYSVVAIATTAGPAWILYQQRASNG
jgi:hypothetical protein